MSPQTRWACALVLAAVPHFARPSTGDTPLRWADLAAAVDKDPRVLASRSLVRSAEGGLGAARTPPNPELEASAGRAEAREGSASRNEWELELTIPLDWLARRGPEVAAARAGVAEASAEAAALRAEVKAELWRLYVGASYAHAEVETLEATERQVDALTGLVRRRVEAGEGRPVEVPRVELELERVRNQLASARADEATALAGLGAWLGAMVPHVEPAPALPQEAGAAEPGDLDAHPRLRAALARAEAARAEATVARRSRFPALSVGAFAASELDSNAVGGKVGLELPVWNWRSGEVQRAEAAAQAESSRAEAERRALLASFAEARATCDRARAVAERHARNILPRAEESARVFERTFQLGEAGLLDVIDARRVVLEARREVLSSARDRDVACGTLMLLSGLELP